MISWHGLSPHCRTRQAPCPTAFLVRRAQLQPSGKRVGFLTPVLYGPGPDGKTPLAGQAGFNDIHAGDNLTAQVGGFKSRAGYDAVTGWGTPKGRELLAALAELL